MPVALVAVVAALDALETAVDDERTDFVEEEELNVEGTAEILLLTTLVNALVGALVVLEEV